MTATDPEQAPSVWSELVDVATGLGGARSVAEITELLGAALARLCAPHAVTLIDDDSPAAPGDVPVLRYGTQPALRIRFPGGAPPSTPLGPLHLLAALAGAHLGQLELQAAVVRRSMDLARLNDASRRLAAAESMDEVMRAAAEGLSELSGGGEIGLYELREGVLALTHYSSTPQDFPASLRLVDRLGDPLLGGGGGAAARPGPGKLFGHPVLVRVLAAAGETLGVLALRSPSREAPLAEETVALVEALADHLAVALRNVQLLELSRHQAAFDELTGLASRRHFLAELAREVERVRRQGTSLSMLMVDADHFKAINDTWGHSAGDAVLRGLAACLVAGTRSLDVVGRLGGEELGVLLPSADLDTAMRVAERLRSSIERAVIDWRGAQLRVTVSIGVAEWDAEMALDDLAEAADLALYEAKRLGRNRIMAAPGMETLLGP